MRDQHLEIYNMLSIPCIYSYMDKKNIFPRPLQKIVTSTYLQFLNDKYNIVICTKNRWTWYELQIQPLKNSESRCTYTHTILTIG